MAAGLVLSLERNTCMCGQAQGPYATCSFVKAINDDPPAAAAAVLLLLIELQRQPLLDDLEDAEVKQTNTPNRGLERRNNTGNSSVSI